MRSALRTLRSDINSFGDLRYVVKRHSISLRLNVFALGTGDLYNIEFGRAKHIDKIIFAFAPANAVLAKKTRKNKKGQRL